MTKTLQQIRKDAGFRSAREFAESAGIPVSTYTRYEQSPDTIPIKAAWELADKFGCSIDAVVGRVEPEPDAMRGEVQRFYDSLSAPSRAAMDDYMGYISYKEQEAAKRAEEEAAFKRRQSVMRYMNAFIVELEVRSGGVPVTASFEELRPRFRKFLEEKFEDSGLDDDMREEAIERLMGAYDEVNHIGGDGGGNVKYAYVRI